MAARSFNFIELCAGVGGLGLGVRLAEPASRCVAYVEREAYVAAILAARMASGELAAAPVWTDLRTFDARPWRGKVHCVLSSDPCQPHSKAGRQGGVDDDRCEIEHVIRAFDVSGAARFFRENVTGNCAGQLEALVPALERLGCRVAAGIFTASEVGASHRRERLFVMAERPLGDALLPHGLASRGTLCAGRSGADDAGQPVAGARSWSDVGDASGTRSQGWRDDAGADSSERNARPAGARLPAFAPGPHDASWPELLAIEPSIEPAVRRVANGFPHRVDRLRACGNACVPLVAAYAWRALEAVLEGASARSTAVTELAA